MLICTLINNASLANPSKVKDNPTVHIFSWLKQHYTGGSNKAAAPSPPPSHTVVNTFSRAMTTLITDLPAISIFLLLDIWHLTILDPMIMQVSLVPLVQVLTPTNESLSSSLSSSLSLLPHAMLLMLLCLSINALGTSLLSQSLLSTGANVWMRAMLMGMLVKALLHTDRLMHVAVVSLAFNVGVWVQRGRVARVRGKELVVDGIEGKEDGEWEVKLVSIIVEVLVGEEESEDVFPIW
jgi:PUL domain